jgi:uncharacterized protein
MGRQILAEGAPECGELTEPALLLKSAAAKHQYPLLFATISGAHLYGFPSADSDFDLRGAHILPVEEVVGLDAQNETVESMSTDDGIELDLVTHDVKKFFLLMLKRNGYVLEQLYSPLVVSTTAEHQELKAIGKSCITRHHYHHYYGFATSQWRLFTREEPPRVKPLLYVYRVLLTGIHLLRTGRIEADLNVLNADFGIGIIDELIAAKRHASEDLKLAAPDLQVHEQHYQALLHLLESAYDESTLPETPTAKPALDDLLKRVRLGGRVGYTAVE